MSVVVTSRSAVAARSMSTPCGGGSWAATMSRIWALATLALKKYSGASRRTITRRGTGSASGWRDRSPNVAPRPGIRPRTATYGRLARYSRSSTDSSTATIMPASTVVRSTPIIAVTAMTKSVRRHAQ